MRTVVYLDGYNFYYGAIKGTEHKWLDLERLFCLLRPHDEVETIHYFTALIPGRHRQNQMRYLRALSTSPTVSITLGKYKHKKVRCHVPECNHSGSRMFTTTEEKRTDVNIALRMAADAFEAPPEQMILVSGDSDLVPAVDLVKEKSPETRVCVYVPARDPKRGAAVELRAAADRNRTFPNALLPRAQFPAEIPDGRGGVIRKPDGW